MATKYYPTCGCFTRRVILGLVAPYNEQCPALCGNDVGIVGISNIPTTDGWYLQVDASNLVYIESGSITQTVPCESGLAAYGHPDGINGGYEFPHYFSNSVNEWIPLISVAIKDNGGFEYQFTVYGTNLFDFTGATTLIQYSTDLGATWINGGSGDAPNDPGLIITFNTGTTNFLYRTIVTLANGCQFYNPAPDTGSPSYGIYYATIDPQSDPLFILLGSINTITPLDDPFTDWVEVLLTMVDPYQTVAGRIGGIGVDFSQLDGGGGFQSPFYLQIISPIGSVPTSLADVLDSSGTPFDTSVQGVSTVIKNYVATYNFTDIDLAIIEGFKIFGADVRFDNIGLNNAAMQQYVTHAMEDYQIADSGFIFTAEISATDIQFFVTSAVPFTHVLIDETGVGSTEVPLIEI